MYSKIIISVVVLLSIFSWGANAQTNTETKCAEIDEYCQNHWDCCSGSCLSFSYKCVRSNRPAAINPIGVNSPQSGGGIVDFGNRFSGSNTQGGTAANTTCVGGGQYCQYHWDCCSQSCLSFSHKCSGSTLAAAPQYPLFTQSGFARPISSQSSGSGAADLGTRFGENANRPNPSITVVPVQQGIIYGEQPSVVNSIDDLLGSINFNLPGVNSVAVPQTQTRFGDDSGATSSKNCLEIGVKCENGPDCCSLNCAYSVCMAGYNQTNGAEHSNKPCLEIGEKCLRHDECCTGRCHGFLHQCVT